MSFQLKKVTVNCCLIILKKLTTVYYFLKRDFIFIKQYNMLVLVIHISIQKLYAQLIIHRAGPMVCYDIKLGVRGEFTVTGGNLRCNHLQSWLARNQSHHFGCNNPNHFPWCGLVQWAQTVVHLCACMVHIVPPAKPDLPTRQATPMNIQILQITTQVEIWGFQEFVLPWECFHP